MGDARRGDLLSAAVTGSREPFLQHRLLCGFPELRCARLKFNPFSRKTNHLGSAVTIQHRAWPGRGVADIVRDRTSTTIKMAARKGSHA
jgi:hypothetical protein